MVRLDECGRVPYVAAALLATDLTVNVLSDQLH